MKYRVFFLLTVIVGFGLFAINHIAYGFQESKSFYDLYYENELLVKGIVVSSANNPLNEELTGYNVKVIEQYSKPSQSFNLITVFDPLNTQSFDVDDTVFLYLNKIDNAYMISPYSFKIPANCGELSFTGLSYLPWQNPPRSSPAGISLEIVDLQGNQEPLLEVGIGYIIQTDKFWYEPTDQLDLEIIIQNTDKNEIVFQEQKTHYGDPCNWKDVKWHLTFDNTGHYAAFIIKHEQLFADKLVRPSMIQTVEFTVGIDDESLSKASMINPSLKEQMNLGLPIDAMYCRNDLTLIQKYNGSPACVTERTKQKLVERGWTTGNSYDYSNLISDDVIDSDKGNQTVTSTWNLEEYVIPITLNNIVLDYIRAEYHNQKILMYITMENKSKTGLVEFTLPKQAASLIFDNPTCTIFQDNKIEEFLLQVNQKTVGRFNAEYAITDNSKEDNDILLSITTPSNSSAVEIFSMCSSSLPPTTHD